MSADPTPPPTATLSTSAAAPRIVIQFCTQCKWMLRAAYFAQELLSTFSTALGEVALQPSTGGTFIVTIQHLLPTDPSSSSSSSSATLVEKTLWDRSVDGGFPETKELKRRVRDVIQPGRHLGHVDRGKTTAPPPQQQQAADSLDNKEEEPCASGDCRV
ncbi:hypothetical protein TD95_000968 [Thielaviopsis punctulata]|uniref:Selenoprotein W-like protein n=1 Tax=Thielaviopsis punctulata TaxID=72032 RepID=A0A0F4ZE32_9PEZI|nr:hypothetical protein TD95_000968 [Thielaviopsis punctulata]